MYLDPALWPPDDTGGIVGQVFQLALNILAVLAVCRGEEHEQRVSVCSEL